MTTGHSQFAETNGIKLHYLDYAGGGTPILLLPGLTANAWSFEALAEGLSPGSRVIAVDLRGRGLSDKPATGYSQADHAADIVGLLDQLGLEQIILGGHSFGGLLALYIAATYPDRIRKLIIMDAGIMNPKVGDLIRPSVDRLGKTWPSWDAYLATMRAAPHFNGWWSPAIESYFRADVQTNPDGSVQPRSAPQNIAECSAGLGAVNWLEIFPKVVQPAILINAPGPYGPGTTEAVMLVEGAKQTVAMLPDCRYVQVPGNHMTMLYGDGAAQIVAAVREFVNQ